MNDMRPYPYRQAGVALVISLIILLIMTLIGVTAMRSTILEEKMAGNTRNRSLAFQAAESALREAEAALASWDAAFIDSNFGAGVGNGLYDQNHAPDPRASDTWTGNGSRPATDVPGTAAAPRYYIRRLATVGSSSDSPGIRGGMADTPGSDVTVFEITVRGVGGTADAQVLLRSHYGVAL